MKEYLVMAPISRVVDAISANNEPEAVVNYVLGGIDASAESDGLYALLVAEESLLSEAGKSIMYLAKRRRRGISLECTDSNSLIAKKKNWFSIAVRVAVKYDDEGHYHMSISTH